ncbi:conserved membrane hypothetical protein [Candidatus Terasakiella magnetica]|nr:conserved membrane hypothetical protein [Candidatus Terasakiella magnetica]
MELTMGHRTVQRMRKLLIAYATAPSAAAVLALVLALPLSPSAAPWASVLIAGASYAIALTVGVPCHLFLIRLGFYGVFPYMISGFAIGAVVPSYFLIFNERTADLASCFISFQDTSLASVAGILGLMGASNTLLFWLLVRPDRAAPLENAP